MIAALAGLPPRLHKSYEKQPLIRFVLVLAVWRAITRHHLVPSPA